MTDNEKMALKLAIDTMERNLKRYCDRVMFNDKKGIRVGYGEAIDVLENMLKESELCIAKYNNGWIPCSEQLPEEVLNSVIGWDEYRECCCFVQYYGGRWILGNDIDSVKVIAWQPLPEPYQPKGEHDENTN